MLMLALASERNILAAVPGVQGIPAPTALMRAMAGPSSKWVPGHCFSSGVRACWALGRSPLRRVKLMSRLRLLGSASLGLGWVRSDCTMASRLMPASARARHTAAAVPGRSGSRRTLTWAWSRSRATPRTAGSPSWQTPGLRCSCCSPNSNTSAAARRALLPWCPATRQLTFTSLVAIRRRLMPALASVSNSLAATPGRPRMPAPEMLSLAMAPSALSWAPPSLGSDPTTAPSRASTSRQTSWAWSSSASARVKAMSLVKLPLWAPSWVACTIKSTLRPAAPSASNNMAATPG